MLCQSARSVSWIRWGIYLLIHLPTMITLVFKKGQYEWKNTAFRECKKNNADMRTYQTVHEYKPQGHCRPMHALSSVMFLDDATWKQIKQQ